MKPMQSPAGSSTNNLFEENSSSPFRSEVQLQVNSADPSPGQDSNTSEVGREIGHAVKSIFSLGLNQYISAQEWQQYPAQARGKWRNGRGNYGGARDPNEHPQPDQ